MELIGVLNNLKGELLVQQLKVMLEYQNILIERIALIQDKVEKRGY